MMKTPPNLGVDDGGPTAAAVIEMLRAVTHTLTPAERLAVVRLVREGMNLVPPTTDQRQRARIAVARAVPGEVADSLASALETSIIWQGAADATPEEMRALRAFEEHRPLFDELGTFGKILKFNINNAHYNVIAKSRDAYRTGRTLSGPAGQAIQPTLDAVAPALSRGVARKKKPVPAEEKK